MSPWGLPAVSAGVPMRPTDTDAALLVLLGLLLAVAGAEAAMAAYAASQLDGLRVLGL